MKLLSFLIIAATLATGSFVKAQGIPCPIPCSSESFPYYFCDILGARHLKCSKNPWNDTNDIPPLTPSMSHLPGCVNVVPIDPSLDYQPAGPVPVFTETPPDRETIFENYVDDPDAFPLPPWKNPTYDENPGFWLDDTLSYADAWAQWDIDSEFYFANIPQEIIAYDSDDIAYNLVINFYNGDKSGFFNIYDDLDSTYVHDSTNHANGTDVNYDQVWSNSQANSDAQSGLNAWLAVCGLTGDSSCCILIKPDDSVSRWPGNYTSTSGQAIQFGVGYTFGTGSYCKTSSSCPDQSSRYIVYNTTNKFFYKNNTNSFSPDPNYILRPAAPIVGWFTGTTSPRSDNAVDPNYSDVSFKQVVEHEIGHFLGMLHPTQITDDGSECINNQTQCGDSLENPMLMSTGTFINTPPSGLQPDDKCMFSKLYCYGEVLAVQDAPQQPDWFNPQVFPNPSNGGMTLNFEVKDRSFVQIGIYDLLGKEMNIVSSGYDEQGAQSLSLGTESLPSGNYVCRARVEIA